jgi:acetyl-CoA acetyltransferase
VEAAGEAGPGGIDEKKGQRLHIPTGPTIRGLDIGTGAIALGHPLGCTGARQIATLLHELHRRKQRYGVVSMCIGTGMGAAAVLEVETESRL